MLPSRNIVILVSLKQPISLQLVLNGYVSIRLPGRFNNFGSRTSRRFCSCNKPDVRNEQIDFAVHWIHFADN